MTEQHQTYSIRTRFDLEQEILECWKVVNDIELFHDQGADMKSLSAYYEQKFQRLWDTFEQVIANKQI